MYPRLLLTLFLAILFNCVSAQKWSDYDHKWTRYELDSNLAIYLPGQLNPLPGKKLDPPNYKELEWHDAYITLTAYRRYINLHDTLMPGLVIGPSIEKQDAYLETQYNILKKKHKKTDRMHWENGRYHGITIHIEPPIIMPSGDTVNMQVALRMFMVGNCVYSISSMMSLDGNKGVVYKVNNKFADLVEFGPAIHFTIPKKSFIKYRWKDFNHDWVHYKLDSFLTVDFPDTPTRFENRIEYVKDSVRFMVSHMPILTELRNEVLRDSLTKNNYLAYMQQLVKEVNKQYPSATIKTEQYKGIYVANIGYNVVENLGDKTIPFRAIEKYFVYNDQLYDVYVRYPLSTKNDVILRILKKYLISIDPKK